MLTGVVEHLVVHVVCSYIAKPMVDGIVEYVRTPREHGCVSMDRYIECFKFRRTDAYKYGGALFAWPMLKLGMVDLYQRNTCSIIEKNGYVYYSKRKCVGKVITRHDFMMYIDGMY